MEEKMTVFYRKRTNEITSISSQETDFRFYGELAEDYKLIYDFIVVASDDFVKLNANMFIIDNGQLKLKIDLSKYI